MPQINRGECMLIIYFINSEIFYNQTHYQKNWVQTIVMSSSQSHSTVPSIYTMIVTKQLLGKGYTLKKRWGGLPPTYVFNFFVNLHQLIPICTVYQYVVLSYTIPLCCFVLQYVIMLFCCTICQYVVLLYSISVWWVFFYSMSLCLFVVQYAGMLFFCTVCRYVDFFTVCRYAVSDSVCGSGGMYPRGGVQIIGNITDLSHLLFYIIFRYWSEYKFDFFSNYLFNRRM